MNQSKWSAAAFIVFFLPLVVCAQSFGISARGIVLFVVWTCLTAIVLHVSTLIAKIDTPSMPKAFICAVLMMVAPTALAFLNLPYISGAIAGILSFVLGLVINFLIILGVYQLSTDKAAVVFAIHWVLGHILSAAVTPILLGIGSSP